MDIKVEKRVLHFKQPAGTSRGVYRTRTTWLVTVTDGDASGIGECAPLPRLSCDDMVDYETVLRRFCGQVVCTGAIDMEAMRDYPSMLFGLETAMLSLRSVRLFDTPFSRGEEGIPINGLVWMGTHDQMLARIEEKLQQGFGCLKLKIGALDFKKELNLIQHIRERYTPEQIELRVDANGGFLPGDALSRLRQLAKYHIHSIEQPIMAGRWDEMAELCRHSPVPIALDEELIGVNEPGQKMKLLDTLRPQYVILKPSLHGGVAGTREWASLAAERGVGSWITSALESNVGLNAIAQLAAFIYGPRIAMPQGLGTGMLFADNVPMPLEIRKDQLWISANS